LFVVSGTPSMPSITPPQPGSMGSIPPGQPGLEMRRPDSLLHGSPTTGQGVSLDDQLLGERATEPRLKVSLGLGAVVAVGALLAGVGIAFLGRSFFVGSGGGQAAEVATAAPFVPAPTLSLPAADVVSPSAPATSGSAGPASSAPSPVAIPGVPYPAGSGWKQPIKPRKPKEKDFGF
jgi:hypothetical protein